MQTRFSVTTGGLVNAGVARQVAGTLDQIKGLDAVRRGTPGCVREHGSGSRAQLESYCLGNSPDHIHRGRAAACEIGECARRASISGLRPNASSAAAGRHTRTGMRTDNPILRSIHLSPVTSFPKSTPASGEDHWAAPKSILVLIGSLHRLFRPQQQGRRSVNPFTLVPAVPSDALRVSAVGGSEGGALIAKKLEYGLAPDIESPAFVPFRANPENTNCRLERVDIFLHRQKL